MAHNKTDLSTSINTLFPKKHQVNYYVHRSEAIRNTLKELWGKGPEDKSDLATMNINQQNATKINALFRHLENYGPSLKDCDYRITLDKKHGAANLVKEGCVSKGYYHTHISDSRSSYIVMWERFEDKNLINIVAIGEHENFNFQQKGRNPLQGMHAAMLAAKNANFNGSYNPEEYNNKPVKSSMICRQH